MKYSYGTVQLMQEILNVLPTDFTYEMETWSNVFNNRAKSIRMDDMDLVHKCMAFSGQLNS